MLFICSGNRDRSPTAEDLFRDSNDYEAKSAGTHPLAVQRIT
ncbi:MAG TPA: phosphotyrosine protein phosphatase, partial [Terriglobales bacterium]|nr:phosphotyrosine protein phosphatase [Terriglobales bacterium]